MLSHRSILQQTCFHFVMLFPKVISQKENHFLQQFLPFLYLILMKFDQKFANVFRKWKTIWRFAEFVAKFCEHSLKSPNPNKLFIIQFIFSIHFLGQRASRAPQLWGRRHAVPHRNGSARSGQQARGRVRVSLGKLDLPGVHRPGQVKRYVFSNSKKL